MTEPNGDHAIEFRGAGAQMGTRTIWKDVTLSVSTGEFVALLGPNGVGKTILLKVILGLVPLAEGEVRGAGSAPREARSRIGYLPQARAFDQSVRVRGLDLVRLGLDGDRWGMPFPAPCRSRSADRDGARRVREVIELVGASAYAERPIGNLSGGEQQRLLIAQAIVHRPDLLLLDEPLASLDYPNQMAITALVGSISREEQMTVMMVTHDVNPIIGQAEKLIYIAKQGVVSGRPAEILTGPILSRIYGSPVEVHYTAGGRLLVVGEPEGQPPGRPPGQPPELTPAEMAGRIDEEEHECCEHPG